jgi:uncharacterized RDD family membrane protein YckC
MAYGLDLIILVLIAMAVSGAMAFSPEEIVTNSNDPGYIGVLLLIGGIDLLYRFVMEWAFGWTIGKRILGLRVAEIDGSRLTFRGAILRNLTRIIDGQIPFGMILGLFLMLKTERRQRLGDLLGRTVVLQDL